MSAIEEYLDIMQQDGKAAPSTKSKKDRKSKKTKKDKKEKKPRKEKKEPKETAQAQGKPLKDAKVEKKEKKEKKGKKDKKAKKSKKTGKQVEEIREEREEDEMDNHGAHQYNDYDHTEEERFEETPISEKKVAKRTKPFASEYSFEMKGINSESDSSMVYEIIREIISQGGKLNIELNINEKGEGSRNDSREIADILEMMQHGVHH